MLAALVVVASLTACTGATPPPELRNAAEACDVEPQWGLADTLGVDGHDSPRAAAEATAAERGDLPTGSWYVVREQGERAFLAPAGGPWRLEAARTDDLGWIVVSGLTCAGPTPGPHARPPLAAWP